MTDAEIITWLGGTTAVAAALGEKRSTVTNWVHPHRAIPQRMRPAIFVMAKKRGLHINQEEFFYLPPIRKKPAAKSRAA